MDANIRVAAGSRFRNPAPSRERAGTPLVRRRYAGPLTSVYEWCCGGHGPREPAEEWAEAYEVVLPRRGAFEWEIEGHRQLADPGTATFFHPTEPYRVRHPVGGGDAGTVFHLTAAAVSDLLAEADPSGSRDGPRFPVRHLPLDGRAYLLARLALRAASDPGAMTVEVEERVAAFLREAMGQAVRRRSDRHASRRERTRGAEYAARVAEVVAERYREPLGLAQVADAVGVSPFHLSRVVASATGIPIYRMIRRRRLREALELLLERDGSISRIALTVGFASHSHLTDAFRREYGLTPSAVRRLRAPRR